MVTNDFIIDTANRDGQPGNNVTTENVKNLDHRSACGFTKLSQPDFATVNKRGKISAASFILPPLAV